MSPKLVRQGGPRDWGRVALGVVAVWAVLVGLVLLEVLPSRPTTAWGWMALIVGGPPAYLAFSCLGEWTMERLPHGPPERFSFWRLLGLTLAVLFGAVVLVFGVWLALWFGR